MLIHSSCNESIPVYPQGSQLSDFLAESVQAFGGTIMKKAEITGIIMRTGWFFSGINHSEAGQTLYLGHSPKTLINTR
jgi:hypothetical protein